MSAEKKKSKTPLIKYRLGEIKIINFFENGPEKYGLKRDDLNACEVNINVGLDIKPENKGIGFIIKVVFYKNIEGTQKDFFGIETLHVFYCENFEEIFPQNDDNSYRIPNQFMGELLKMAISGTRGMLVAACQNSLYKSMPLPLVDTKPMLKNLSTGVIAKR